MPKQIQRNIRAIHIGKNQKGRAQEIVLQLRTIVMVHTYVLNAIHQRKFMNKTWKLSTRSQQVPQLYQNRNCTLSIRNLPIPAESIISWRNPSLKKNKLDSCTQCRHLMIVPEVDSPSIFARGMPVSTLIHSSILWECAITWLRSFHSFLDRVFHSSCFPRNAWMEANNVSGSLLKKAKKTGTTIAGIIFKVFCFSPLHRFHGGHIHRSGWRDPRCGHSRDGGTHRR
jgi:hypothetical protein